MASQFWQNGTFPWQGYDKTSNKKRTTSVVNFLQNELNRDEACFTIYKKNTLQPYLLQDGFKLACEAGVPYGRGMEFGRPKYPFPSLLNACHTS